MADMKQSQIALPLLCLGVEENCGKRMNWSLRFEVCILFDRPISPASTLAADIRVQCGYKSTSRHTSGAGRLVISSLEHVSDGLLG
jgi:hypothetical protein